jgi:orotidine-5'-phosphate decarboxylase
VTRRCGIIVALDTPDPAEARRLARAVAPWCPIVKLGPEFLLANGPAGVVAIAALDVFLDVKLHDIPNTVAGAVRSALRMQPRMLTLHAAGGTAMIEAAAEAARAGGAPRPSLLAVTTLTSIDAVALAATGVSGTMEQQVLRLGRLAVAAGADGLICAPSEVASLREALGEAPLLVVPGIRPIGVAAHDQSRTATPREAAVSGADWIVVGRPITAAPSPAAAAAAIAAELDA